MGLLKTYEVAIYNQEVRASLEQGKRHPGLGEKWAETHYLEVQATSEEEARAKLARRYPASAGYVIVDVYALKFDE